MATQITPTSELQTVNQMLSVIGEAPVNAITGTVTTDVSVAKNILDETTKILTIIIKSVDITLMWIMCCTTG